MKKKQLKLYKTQRIKRKGKYWQVTRDTKGKIVKFKKWKLTRKMWRIGVYVNWVNHHKYYSSKCLNYLTKLPKTDELKAMMEEKEQKARKEAESQLGYSLEEMMLAGAEISIGQEKEKVEYNKNLIGEEIVKTEFVKEKHDRRRFLHSKLPEH